VGTSSRGAIPPHDHAANRNDGRDIVEIGQDDTAAPEPYRIVAA